MHEAFNVGQRVHLTIGATIANGAKVVRLAVSARITGERNGHVTPFVARLADVVERRRKVCALAIRVRTRCLIWPFNTLHAAGARRVEGMYESRINAAR